MGELHEAIEWVLIALSGKANPADVPLRLAPRLTERGDVATFLAHSERYAAFRENELEIERIEEIGPRAVRARIRLGADRWDLDVALEDEPSRLIRSFQPRPVATDGIEWASVRPRLRADDSVTSSLPGELVDRVHQRLLAAVDEDRIVGLAAVIARDGEVVHTESLGARDVERTASPGGHDTFRVGSVTKIVTALAVMRLAQSGAVDLDAPVRDYLPAPEIVPADPGDPAPTVAQLLLHRAGLPKSMLAREIRLAWAPGERAEYSNIGYDLLGLLIARVSGRPYADFCESEVLRRYGANDASLPREDVPPPATVTGYRVAGGRLAAAPPPTLPLPASGGMSASSSDLIALADCLIHPVDAVTESMLARTTPAGRGVRFAPGVALLDRPSGALLWRGGSTDGFTAEIIAAFDGSVTVALLANATPAPGLRSAATDVASALRSDV